MADGETSLDAQLELKKRARRRLVGASALALLAAIMLPMVMDHEPRPPAQDIQVRIPNADTSFVSRVVPSKPAATPLPPVDAKTAAKPEPKSEAPVAVEPSVGKPAEKVVEKKLEEKKSGDKKSEEARANAALEGADGGAWVVQLGAYKETGNVKLLISKLKEMKVPAYTEQFDSPQGARTRVRAGPFPSKDAAEKARAKIKVIGVDGPVAPK